MSRSSSVYVSNTLLQRRTLAMQVSHPRGRPSDSAFLSLLTALVLSGCSGAPEIPPPPLPIVEGNRGVERDRRSGIERSMIDPAITPANDFYRFACGRWLQETTIPAGKMSFGFYDIANAEVERQILSTMTATPAKADPLRSMACTLHRSGMDERTIEELDLEPLAPLLREIAALRDNEGLSRTLAHMQLVGATPFFQIHRPLYWEVLGDNYVYLRQTQLGLVDGVLLGRDRDERLVRAQHDYVGALLKELGHAENAALARADGIMALEKRLASHAMSSSELRNFRSNHNVRDLDELRDLVTPIQWGVFFSALDLEEPSGVIVGQLALFEELGRILDQQDWPLIRAYLEWALISEFATELGPRFAQLAATFRDRVQGGAQSTAREDTIARLVTREMPDVVGALYLGDFLPRSSRDRVLAMITNLRAAFDARLRANTWLEEDTRARALAKLANLRFLIGGPEQPRYYAGLELDKGTFLANILSIRRIRMREHLRHTNQAVIHKDWRTAAHEANAWYQPSRNSIVLSAAGINELFRAECDNAFNYGTLGTTIAHEMMHGFDNNGRLYDERQRRREWWSSADMRALNSITGRLVRFYESFDLPVDGARTLDENLPDVVGLRVAYDAYRLSLGDATPAQKSGFSDSQRFFLAYAQKWREQLSPDALQRRLQGWHAPPQLRTNVPALLCAAFHDAFPRDEGEVPELIPVW